MRPAGPGRGAGPGPGQGRRRPLTGTVAAVTGTFSVLELRVTCHAGNPGRLGELLAIQ